MLVVISLFLAINLASAIIGYFLSHPKLVVKRDGIFLYKGCWEVKKIR